MATPYMTHNMVFLVAVVAVLSGTVATNHTLYSRVRDCKESIKVYEYTISGDMHDHRGKEQAVTTAKVHLYCVSEGTLNGEDVNHYRIILENVITKVYNIRNSYDVITGITQKKYLSSISDTTARMSKYFSFFRNEKGSLVKVFYLPEESSGVVNFKKTIASAFQVNFDGTKMKKEIDTQSKHTAHYKYDKKGSSMIQHRTIDTNDVSRFSGNANNKGVDFHSKEDIEVGNDHIIRESRGDSTTSLTKEDKKEEQVSGMNADIPPIETKSVYTLKLIKEVPRVNLTTQQQAYSMEESYTDKGQVFIQDDLLAQDDDEDDIAIMKEYHNELPDLQETAHRVARSTTDVEKHDTADAVLKWREILYLESKHGAFNGGKPKLTTIIENLNKAWFSKSNSSYHLRLMIYSLLGSEGSLQAQQTLMKALRLKQFEDDEYESIVMAITLLPNIDHSILLDYKTYFLANGTSDDQLLLSLATLGRHKNVEQEVINTILMEGQRVNDTEGLVHFIHALGNTGSKLIIPYLLPLLLDDSADSDVHLTVIDALRTVSTDERVQKVFTDLIDDCNSSNANSTGEDVDIMLAIIESLKFPYESSIYFPEEPENLENEEIWNNLLSSLVAATMEYDSDVLHNAAVSFLESIETNFTSTLLSELQSVHKSITKRSASNNWGRRSSIYDLIASRSSRLSDKKNYRFHKAYLWGKKLGPSKIHLKLAAGGFAGAGSKGYKIFGRAVAQFYFFGKKYEVLKAEYLNRYSFKTSTSTIRRYVKVRGYTYLPRSAMAASRAKLPYNQKWRRTFKSLKVFRLHKKFFVKVGFLTVVIRGDVNIGATMSISATKSGAKGEVSFGPTFTVRGDAHVTLMGVHRIGIKLKASIGYYITPKASVTLCDTAPRADASACFGVFHGSKGVNVNIYAYYKYLKCWYKRVGWSIRKKCKWGREARVKLLSSNFKLRGLSQRLLWGKCLACSNKQLNQYCSSRSITSVKGITRYSCRTVGYQ